MSGKPDDELVRVIVIDDSDTDRDLIRIAFQRAALPNPLAMAGSGEEGLALIRQHAGEPMLVLLDLNMPGMDGQEVLAEIRRDPEIRTTPVVILTSSDLPDDIAASYERNANAFIRKPVRIDGLTGAIAAIDHFWLKLVRYPGET